MLNSTTFVRVEFFTSFNHLDHIDIEVPSAEIDVFSMKLKEVINEFVHNWCPIEQKAIWSKSNVGNDKN